MYEIPSDSSVSKGVIDENVINGVSEPILIYENQDKKQKASSE